MPQTMMNRFKFDLIADYIAANDVRMLGIIGTTVGVNNPDLNTVADLDAVVGVSIHSERLPITGEAVAQNDAADRAELSSNSPAFAVAGGVTLVGVALYEEGGGTDATRTLLGTYTDNFPAALDTGLIINVTDLLYQT